MRCPTCGFDQLTGIRFCGRCGSTLSLRCGHCGVENPSGFAFCGQCSVPLTGALPHTSHAAYAPTHLAENILHTETALEGERKQVTVLFADLKGSLELLADRGPQHFDR
jgi:Double zinc ribbon